MLRQYIFYVFFEIQYESRTDIHLTTSEILQRYDKNVVAADIYFKNRITSCKNAIHAKKKI